MDIDYLIDDIFGRVVKLNIEDLKKTDTRYFIAATNSETGEQRFFTNDDNVDVLELLRATKAVPVAFNRFVPLDDGRYCDLYLHAALPESIRQAISAGATDIVVIDSSEPDGLLDSIMLRGYGMFVGKRLRAKVETELGGRGPDIFGTAENIVWVRPSRRLAVGLLTRRKKKLEEAFQMGFEDVASLGDVRGAAGGRSGRLWNGR